MYYADKIVKEVRKSRQIVIFGAGIVAYNAVNCLIGHPYRFKIEYCVVSDMRSNPAYVMGIPVIDLKKAETVIKKDAVFFIAATDKNLTLIWRLLHSRGFLHTIALTFDSDLWECFRGDYFREYCLANGQPYRMLEEELGKIEPSSVGGPSRGGARVYAVRSHADRKLKEDMQRFTWEIPIQAGAALTEERMCAICDNTGEHISNKNREYCELTALYWIWKNDRSDYVGICHYRRHFEINEKMLEKLTSSDIDVLLTIPILNFPSVRAVYENDHSIEDWDIMLEAIGKLTPDYVEAADMVQNGRFYSGYNMLVARKRILDRYCEWLFPILAYCEQNCQKKEDRYQNRYIGFLAERLLSIYFTYHKKDYKIVYGRKHFVDE